VAMNHLALVTQFSYRCLDLHLSAFLFRQKL